MVGFWFEVVCFARGLFDGQQFDHAMAFQDRQQTRFTIFQHGALQPRNEGRSGQTIAWPMRACVAVPTQLPHVRKFDVGVLFDPFHRPLRIVRHSSNQTFRQGTVGTSRTGHGVLVKLIGRIVDAQVLLIRRVTPIDPGRGFGRIATPKQSFVDQGHGSTGLQQAKGRRQTRQATTDDDHRSKVGLLGTLKRRREQLFQLTWRGHVGGRELVDEIQAKRVRFG